VLNLAGLDFQRQFRTRLSLTLSARTHETPEIMNEPSKSAQPNILIAAVIAAVVGAVVGTSVVSKGTGWLTGANTTSQTLKQISDATNKNLPMTVDRNTRLDSTAAMPGGKFLYRYTITAQDGLPEADEFVPALKAKLQQIYQTADDMEAMRSTKATLVYQYHLETGEQYARFEVPFSESRETMPRVNPQDGG